ncbi:MAG: endopeptidase La [Clostridiales bacterium]|nr:endopeptidase La [Clostridiales bacterium]
MIATRGIVVFPGQTINFDIARDKSLSALQRAAENKEDIFVVAQRRATIANPAPKDIYRVGTVCKIKQVLKLPNDTVRVLVVGLSRMRIENYVQIAPFFEVQLSSYGEIGEDPLKLEAAKRTTQESFEIYKKLDHKIPSEVASTLNAFESDKFINAIATFVYTTDVLKQTLLQEKTVAAQLINISKFFAKETEIMAVEKKIAADVRESVAKGQREFYLREQIKAIKKELGDEDEEVFLKKAKEKKLPPYVMEKVKKEAARLEKMAPTSPDAAVLRIYLEWLLDVPWTETTKEEIDLKKAREILDEDHYGLEKVKDRIIEFLAVHKLTNNLKGPILCFVGPPGVGKTSIVASIARAAGKNFVSVSLGGVKDEAEIRGHRRTYIGALPGRIISSMKTAGVSNPVFLFDEVDKMSSDFRGDPASAMLEVLDPNQNNHFTDHYLELPYDLSKVMFVMTANNMDTIPPPLLDRMEIIELAGYSYAEKLQIAKKYLVKKQLEANGLATSNVNFTDDAILGIITGYTRESGVRSLEREIGSVVRKLAVKAVEDGKTEVDVTVNDTDLEGYLGAVKFKDTDKAKDGEVGNATGLAWTSVGGSTLSIEVALIGSGKGELTLTGSLGDVMKESCITALSMLKSRADKYGISMETFAKNDFHIHFPEGATPKDGPSAGITISTALISALTGRKVRGDVAMTGEVTLRGKVLPIGGLKEKSLAALRYGVKTLIIPKDNASNILDIPQEVKDAIKIHLVENIDEVFDIALEK